MQNWCHLYTCYTLTRKYHILPISSEAFEEYCKNKAVHWSGFIRGSDTLSEFWNTIAFLIDQNVIIEGWDYKVESVLQVRLYHGKKDGRPQEYTQTFNEPTKLFFIRLNNVHKHYQQAYRNRTGKEGMSIENLKHYFSGRKSYLGTNQKKKFKRFITKTEEVIQPSLVPGGVPTKKFETRIVSETTPSSSYFFCMTSLVLILNAINRKMEGNH
jgi:hypothetical protein